MPPLLRLSVCPLVFVAGEFGERKHRFVVTAPGLSCPALLPGSQGSEGGVGGAAARGLGALLPCGGLRGVQRALGSAWHGGFGADGLV